MLMMTQLSGFMAGGVLPPELAFIAATEDTNDLTTYTFAGQSIGAADVTRRVVVACHWSAAALRTLSSATIGGVAATIHTTVATGGAVSAGSAAIISALVPTGTTASIVLNLSAAVDRASIAVYRAINETVATPHAVMTDGSLAGTVLSGTINIPINGWVVAGGSFTGITPGNNTWAGVTEQYDVLYADAAIHTRSGGFATGLPPETGRTVSMTGTSGTPTGGTLVAMSWG